MKTFKSPLIVFNLAILFLNCSNSKLIAQNPSVSASISYQDFYDGLSPYGTWIEYPAYGHVWRPAVTGEFRPYLTNGYWDYSNEGWLWQSNYNWGWAPFHYGRWVYDNLYGWLWIPGYEWSPAWVTWGNVDNYYGWAPLMPELNVGMSFRSWRPDPLYWNFVGREHLCDRNIYIQVEKRDLVNNYEKRVTIINNFSNTNLHNQYYAKGPDVKEVEKYTNRLIIPASIKEISNAAIAKRERNKIYAYRPAIIHPHPREFRTIDNISGSTISNSENRMHNDETQQRQNVEKLPIYNAREKTYYKLQQKNNSNRKNKRN